MPFCECQVCAFLHEKDARHVIREAMHAVVLPEDAYHNISGLAVCDEHYHDYRRTRPLGVSAEGMH
jgi:hypothetical protein